MAEHEGKRQAVKLHIQNGVTLDADAVIDQLADVIWWIRGRMDAKKKGFALRQEHVDALIQARAYLRVKSNE